MPADLPSFSEPLGIISEVLNSLLLGKGLFIQIKFGGLCVVIVVVTLLIRYYMSVALAC